MSTRSLSTAAALAALVGCGEADHGDDHGHGHASGKEHITPAPKTDQAPKPDTPPAAAATTAVPQPFAIGGWTGELEASADSLVLTAKDAEGNAATPSGEARVVLTGTGQEPQRIVLRGEEGGWSGNGKAAGAPGYVAVVSLEIDGHTETARVTWGEVPEVEAAPKEEEHHDDAGQDDGHGHGH